MSEKYAEPLSPVNEEALFTDLKTRIAELPDLSLDLQLQALHVIDEQLHTALEMVRL